MSIQERDFDGKKVDFRLWKRLYAYAMRRRWLVILLISALLTVALVDVAYPLLSRYAIDQFVIPKTTDRLAPYIVAYVLLVLLQGAGVVAFIVLAGKLEMDIAYSIRQDAFLKLQELSFAFYDKTAVGYLMARMVSDIGRLSEMVAWSIVDVLWAFLYAVGCVISMFVLNWKLALIAVAVIPPLAVASLYLQKAILKYQRAARKQNSKITGAFNEGIMGAMTTKTLVR